jgi:hypothetical protein
MKTGGGAPRKADTRRLAASSREARADEAPFTVGHFREWCAGLELDDGEPWRLEPFQEAFVADVFAGTKVCWLVVPEGNGKTTLIAGLALYHCEFTGSAYVPVAASSRDQAEWIYRQAEGFVLRSGLEDRTRSTAARTEAPHVFRCLEGYRRVRHDATGSRIQIFAADDRGGDGIIPTLAILDELHRHRDLALYRTWLGKLRKRDAQLLVISTAGEVGGEFELERERLRREAETVERDGCHVRAARRGAVLHEWAVPEGGDVEDLGLVKAANPFSGVSVESLVEKRDLPGMTVPHWSRFTCNLAERGDAAAITEAEWGRQRSDREIPAGERVVAGLDLGWKRDTTALVPCWEESESFRLLGPATVLEPPRDGSMLPVDAVKAALAGLHGRTPIGVLVMDMAGGADIAQWAADELGLTVIDRPQSNSFAVADYETFMAGLRNGTLWHSGDAGLTSHALNALARVLPSGQTRFERPRDSRAVSHELSRRRVIDALVAAAMALSEAAGGGGVFAFVLDGQGDGDEEEVAA